jgi:tRNA A-37 threonylcarbamoyl transferase component Bud32
LTVAGASHGTTARRANRVLSGHSGVDVTLLESSGSWVVRKSSRRPDQNDRLRRQGEKLAEAAASGFPCPKVLDDGFREGLYYFDMEYIPGETLANAILTGRQVDWPQIIDQVLDRLIEFSKQESGIFSQSAFHEKLASIARACQKNITEPLTLLRIEKLTQQVADLKWDAVAISPCHGDLTFENIMIRQNGDLIFIDFDVPEHSSWMLDIGKMFQDMRGLWTLRHHIISRRKGVSTPDASQARLTMEWLAELTLQRLETLRPGTGEMLDQFAVFHLLRTLPYSRDPEITGFVIGQVELLVSKTI